MLAPKRTQITAASGAFTDDERGLWLPMLVGSRIYNNFHPPVFSDVDVKLAGVVASSQRAKQLNATMVLIDRIGPVDASTSGQEGIYSTIDNREHLLEYALSVLYGVEYWPRMNSRPNSYRARNRAVLR